MAKTRVKLNNAGFRALRNSAAVVNDLRSRAERVRTAAGNGYVVEGGAGRNRARFVVITAKPSAIRDNAKNNTLIKAMGAGNG